MRGNNTFKNWCFCQESRQKIKSLIIFEHVMQSSYFFFFFFFSCLSDKNGRSRSGLFMFICEACWEEHPQSFQSLHSLHQTRWRCFCACLLQVCFGSCEIDELSFSYNFKGFPNTMVGFLKGKDIMVRQVVTLYCQRI